MSNPPSILNYSFKLPGNGFLAPALMTLDTNAVLGGGGDGGSEERLSTPGCALLATILGFPKVC